MPPKREPERIPVSRFKAQSLALLERVRRSGRSIIVTKRGEPLAEVVPPSAATLGTDWLGSMQGTAQLSGDIVEPLTHLSDWEALGE
jgi:prevent-host-death family protein